jgi:hypothetical protein
VGAGQGAAEVAPPPPSSSHAALAVRPILHMPLVGVVIAPPPIRAAGGTAETCAVSTRASNRRAAVSLYVLSVTVGAAAVHIRRIRLPSIVKGVAEEVVVHAQEVGTSGVIGRPPAAP